MNNLIRVARAVWCEPWLIQPDAHRVLCGILDAHLAGGPREAAVRAAGQAMEDDRDHGDDTEARPYTIQDGIAVVPLVGIIGKRVGTFERSSGVTDVDAFAQAVRDAAADPRAVAILIDIDSPGGTVAGVQAAADTVRRVSQGKPVLAYTSDLMASAAYWIGAAADAVYAEELATVGSIGVYSVFLDQTRAYEMAGLKKEVFASGPFKAAGVSGVPLTDAQRAMIQARVDELAAIFQADVRRTRPAVADATMQGQTFLGRGAQAAGLIDSVASFDVALRDAKAMAAMRTSIPSRQAGGSRTGQRNAAQGTAT